jgi:hypothetical protein
MSVMRLFSKIGFIFFQKITQLLQLHKIAFFTSLYDNACWIKNRPKIAILGSSFAMTSIIPKEISRLNPKYKESEIVNLAQSMGGPYEMYITLKKHQNLLSGLEYVYIGIDPHILGEKFYHYMEVEKQFVTFAQWDYMFKNHTSYMKKYHPSIKLNIFSPIKFIIKMFTKVCKKNSSFSGYQPRLHQGIKEFKEKDIASYTFEPLDLFPVSFFSVSYLKKIENLLAEKSNVKIRYLLSPSYNWQDGYEKYCQNYDNQLRSLLQKNLGDIEIVGSLYKEDFLLKKYDFSDNRHLSHAGALKYTNAIFRDLEKEQIKTHLLPLSSYRTSYRVSENLDSLNQNMALLKKSLDAYLRDKESIILYGFTNLSRCIMSLLENKINNCKICDINHYLRTAPQFLHDDFIAPKEMIHINTLESSSYDSLVVCDFLRFQEHLKTLKQYGVLEKDIFFIDDDSFDASYFHIQINMLFSIVDYISENFDVIYIVGESLVLSLVQNLLSKRKLVRYLERNSVLDSQDLDDSTKSVYLINEDEILESHLQDGSNIYFENIVTIKL